QPIINLWESPRFHGSLQAAAGFTEASIGSLLTFSTYGLAAPIGCALVAHGLDHVTAGMRTAITGTYNETATSQLLQKTGLSEQNANVMDDLLSISGTAGAVKFLQCARAATASTGICWIAQDTIQINTAKPTAHTIEHFIEKIPAATKTLNDIANGFTKQLIELSNEAFFQSLY
ncbi:MAG: hypothetical protein Q8K75_03825, partial [Chlamydiales bacterium]|nr:hypothetical protein [Chlamydiales bacterium]